MASALHNWSIFIFTIDVFIIEALLTNFLQSYASALIIFVLLLSIFE